MASRAKSMMGGGHSEKKKSGKKPHSIHIRRGKSGGYIAQHHFKPSGDASDAMQEPEEHVIPDKEALLEHIDQNMGDQGAAGEQQAQPTSPAPAPQGPPPPAQ